MFQAIQPRWMRLIGGVTFLLTMLAGLPAAFAGTTHTEGGAVSEAPGVPETDASATTQIYWTGDSAARTSVTTGTTLPGYWLHDVGFGLTRQWLVGDEHAAVLEMQTGAGTAAHAGYYGLAVKTLASVDPDVFPGMTVRPIPVPLAVGGPAFIDVTWHAALTAGTPSLVAGYNIYRSTDGIAFTQLNAIALTDSAYHDTAVTFGTNYQYALGLVYRGTPAYPGTAMSVNSGVATPTDATPPDVPIMAGEPGFTPGAANTVAWSDQAASGASAYYAECALDAAFTSLVGNSGWIATTNFNFSGLADGQPYFFRVKARDIANNESAFATAVASQQDASAPASHVLALGTYKSNSTLDLEWLAIDALSGVSGVQLFYAKDGGAFTMYPNGPYTATPIAFDASTTGGDGAYAFYTIAADNVANAETAPEAADATTIFDTQAPAMPALAALPAFTPGLSRDMTWDDQAASGAMEYRIQASTTPTFDAIASTSDWISSLTHTFTGLADGTQYHYRVQSRDAALNESAFSALALSTQDASAPATSVDAMAAMSASPALSIAWTGADASSGLTAVELYYAKDGGAFTLLPGGPYATSPIAFDASAMGGDGTYAFYTLGTDAVGNAEAAPATGDAEIVIDTAPPTAPAIAALPAFTPGAARSIDWTGEGVSFRAQASTDPAFTSLVAESDWTTDHNYTFTGLADATMYYFRVRSRDTVGNESTPSAALASTQDATAPATAVAAMPPTSSATGLEIAWSGTDATSGLTGIELYYSKDGGAALAYPGGPFASSPIAFDALTTGGDGHYTFFARGTDAAGNIEDAPASADAEIVIDTAAPGAPTIAGMTTFTSGAALTLHWSDESASGAAAYRVEMSTDPGFATIDLATVWAAELQHDFAALTDGQHYYFRVQARDIAANMTGYSGMQSTTMDATAPTSQIEPLAALSNDPHLSLAWTGSDATSGIAGVDLYVAKDGGAWQLVSGSPFDATPIALDASALGDGSFAFYAAAHDHVGNTETAPATADAQIMIDTTPAAAPAMAALPPFTAGSDRAITWADASASGATAYRTQASTDAAFATILAETDWAPAIDHTFTGLADGQIHYFRAASRDAAGNVSAFGSPAATTLDASAPATQAAALPATSAAALLSIAWTGNDTASGIANADLYMSKDGGAYTLVSGSPFTASPIAFDASAMGDGQYAFYTRGHDNVGNIEDAPAAADAETMIDTAAPAAPQIAALDNFTLGTSLNLHWDAAIGATEYRAQTSPAATFATPGQDTGWIVANDFNFSGLADGQPAYFRVQSRDAAHNASAFSSLAATILDATAPASQLSALPALLNTPVVSLAWSGTDMTSGIAGTDLYYSRNGSAFALAAGSPFTSSPIAFNSANFGGDGQYAFYLRARDTAGNYEAAPGSPDAQTQIDASAPNAPAIASLAQFMAGSAVLLSWNSQAATGAIEYQAEMSTAADFAAITSQSAWLSSTNFNFNSLDDGTTYWFRVKCRDAAQNESPYATVQTTTLDDTAPASAVAALAPVITTPTFPIAWNGNDATSGVASVDLYYAKDGGAYTVYAGGPWASSPISFDVAATGGEGNYAFYTRARDRVANREPAPGGPDAQTIVNMSAAAVPTLASLPSFTAGTSRTIAWTPGANNIAYFVQASTANTFASIFAESGWMAATSHNFNGLSDGAQYFYRVKARNNLSVESAWSAAMSSTQDASAPASQTAALPALSTASAFDIAWSAADATSGLSGIELYVSRNGGAFAPYAGGPFTTSPIAFDASALGGDGAYAFYTRATDSASNFETAPGTPDAQTLIDTTAPDAPTMLAEPSVTQGASNLVSWSATATAAEYDAECSTDASFATVFATSDWMAATTYSFTGLTDGVTYWYRVRARDVAQNASAWSTPVSSTQSAGYLLSAGWNLISFNVDPANTRIDQVLATIQGKYSVVRGYDQSAFHTYLPGLPVDFSDLQNMDAKHGYWIYMTQPGTLAITGLPTNPVAPINLGTGWNLAGYMPAAPMAPAMALATIAGSYSLARGYETGAGYHTYYPSLPALSDLHEMRSGQGYWFYMTAADQLVYGGVPKAGSAEAQQGGKMPVAARSDAMSVPTVMDVWSTEFTIDGKPAPTGTVLEAYDAQGKLCGTATVKQDGTVGILHIAGDISITDADEGAVNGDAITFKVRGADVVQVGDANTAWAANDSKSIGLEFVNTESLLPKSFALAQNSPNPFNPTTKINYAIPARVNGERIAAAHIDLRIFDVRGRTVRTLVNGAQAPGRYAIVWDGRDERGNALGTGMYFYRLQTPTFTQAKKMMLVK